MDDKPNVQYEKVGVDVRGLMGSAKDALKRLSADVTKLAWSCTKGFKRGGLSYDHPRHLPPPTPQIPRPECDKQGMKATWASLADAVFEKQSVHSTDFDYLGNALNQVIKSDHRYTGMFRFDASNAPFTSTAAHCRSKCEAMGKACG